MTRSGHLALPEVGKYSQMSRSGWEALPDDREWPLALPKVLKWSRRPPGYALVFGRPFQMCGNGQEAILDVRELSEGLPRCPGVVWRPSRMCGSG